jgi:hypothetical protein
MNRIYAAFFAACLMVASLPPPVSAETGENANFITFEMEYIFRKLHTRQKKNSAMAANRNGTVTWSWQFQSRQLAIREAMRNCAKQRTRRARKGEALMECFPLAANGQLLVKEAWSDDAWQKPASGDDLPLLRGRKSVLPLGKSKGVILHVHGCDGLGGELFTDAWGDFFNSLGYDFYAPNSYAETRPGSACGYDVDFPAMQMSRVHRMRVSQTLRTLEILKRENPGKPIFMWGHSEGGLVVQATAADVSGIAVTGANCGAYSQDVAAPKSVPFLYVFGDADPFVTLADKPLKAKAVKRACKSLLGSRNFELVILGDRKHIAWPWNDQTAAAFARLLGTKAIKLSPPLPYSDGEVANAIASAFAAYTLASPHKAFVTGQYGAWQWSQKWDNAEDASQSSLYECAKRISKEYNLFETGRHLCNVLSIDGKTLKPLATPTQ